MNERTERWAQRRGPKSGDVLIVGDRATDLADVYDSYIYDGDGRIYRRCSLKLDGVVGDPYRDSDIIVGWRTE